MQGENLKYNNGSLIEFDKYGIGKLIGEKLLDELRKIGNTFTSAYIVEDVEESVYKSIGLYNNMGHLQFIKDEKSY